MTTESPIHRIGCNLLWLVPGVVGGSEEYTTDLLRAFDARRHEYPDLEVTLFVNRQFGQSHRDLELAFPTVVAPTTGSNKALRVLTESTWLARETRRRGIDVVHHAGGTMPPIRHGVGIVTIHDLQPFSMPEHFSPLKRVYLHWSVPSSVRAARFVVTLSRWTQRDVVRRLGIRPDRMMLVPSGIRPPVVEPDEAAVDRVLTEHDLVGRPFFLYPAIPYPHKNHLVLVRAFAALLRTHPESVLVLTGGTGPSENEVRAEIEVTGVGRRVRRLGRVPAEDLDVLYRRARALAFPSCHEGFGIPVLEAMIRGCPVLAADTTALPEVVGDGGDLLPATDADAWTAAMARIVDDQDWRRDLIERGRRRAGQFSWADSADALATVYRAGAS